MRILWFRHSVTEAALRSFAEALEMPSRAASEAQLQRRIVKACKGRWPGISMQASASGVHLAGGGRAGSLMRLSGVEAGDPDLHVREWGRNGEPSAYVELKVPGGVVRDTQLRQHAALRKRGCAVYILHSEAEFLSAIAEYLPPDFQAADVDGNTERGYAAALRSRADRRLEELADADGGGQHSERGALVSPADAGSSTDVTAAPDPGSSADAPIDLELELSGAGAESEVLSGWPPPTWGQLVGSGGRDQQHAPDTSAEGYGTPWPF